MKSKHSSFVCLQVIPQYIAYSSKSEKNRRLLIITPFMWKDFPFKSFSYFQFFSLSVLGSRKDYFNVTQLENHGLNQADD